MELSSLGLGSYLGSPDDPTDQAYAVAAGAFLDGGGTVLDTAANYRQGRSERALGKALRGRARADFFLSTKVGYLPLSDGTPGEGPRDWFQRVLAAPGVLAPEEVVDGCHAMTPRYLDHQLGVGLRALGLGRVDCLHLHNPEHQRPLLGPRRFDDAVLAAFEACEGFRGEGRIEAYGCATWNGFRVPPEAEDHLSLERLLNLAEKAGGRNHGFRWIQLPLNLAMPEAFLAPTQAFGGRRMPILEAAGLAGLGVQASASIMQGRILGQLRPEDRAQLGGVTPAQSALQFTRSCPGVATALCGMASVAHVAENLGVLPLPKVEPGILRALYC
ncbi:MAG: aldo/keto reductase [Acidobacteria bacterium]|nr:aldo/keto reductase [Acidobacteriota bacterium]